MALLPQIQHSNVVRILHVNDGSSDSDEPYLMMEYVVGGTLETLVNQRKTTTRPFNKEELVKYCLQISRGLAAISEKGIIHRDIKPTNILYDRANDNLKIADFGLAKREGAETRTNTFKGYGTLPYMSPESLFTETATASMDVYSVGVMFFQLASFELPFVSSSTLPAAWGLLHVHGTHSDLRSLRPDLPIEFIQLVHSMIASNADERPTGWTKVIDALLTIQDPATRPGVERLLIRAEETKRRNDARDALARSAQAEQDRRLAVSELAITAVLDQFHRLVEEYNALAQHSFFTTKVSPTAAPSRAITVSDEKNQRHATVICQIHEVIHMDAGEQAWVVGRAVLTGPAPDGHPTVQASYLRGFNIAYVVTSAGASTGTWRAHSFRGKERQMHSDHPKTYVFGIDFEPFSAELTRVRDNDAYDIEVFPLTDDQLTLLLEDLL